MRTAQAAEILGLTSTKLLHVIHQNEIDVPKDVDRYVWSEAHLDQVRAAMAEHRRQREEAASAVGLPARQAAEQLGISYEELLVLVREQQIPVPRPAPFRHYAFDERSLELVRQALAAPPPEPPAPRGLTTKQVAAALGVSYEVLTQVMGPLRKDLPLQKDGSFLVWSAEAIGRVREALARRHSRQWIEEVQDYGGAVRSVAALAGLLRELSTHVEKLQDLLSRKPAETAFIHTLHERAHTLKAPVAALLIPLPGTGFQASLTELSLVTEGRTRHQALRLLRQRLWERYREVRAEPGSAPDDWTVLQQLIVPLAGEPAGEPK